MLAFWKPPSVFSQWTMSEFTVDGITYNCAEQWMMASKARLFIDKETEALILATPNPYRQRQLGRQVQGFDQKMWEMYREEIVYQGNLHKFMQNPEMLKVLLSTGSKILVEASPFDRIWGIGLRAEHPDCGTPTKWRGKNLLGKCLMKVRSQLL